MCLKVQTQETLTYKKLKSRAAANNVFSGTVNGSLVRIYVYTPYKDVKKGEQYINSNL